MWRLYAFCAAAISLILQSEQVCQWNGRQGSYLAFNSSSQFLYTSVPSRQDATRTRNNGMFFQELTVEFFVNIPNNTGASSFQPLAGNLNASFSTNDAGVASGWRIACQSGICCFQAFIGYQWQFKGAAFDGQFRSDRAAKSFQQLCVNVQRGIWFHLAATYSATTGVAALFVNGVPQAQATFTSVGDPDFGYMPSLAINYDYVFSQQPWSVNTSTTGQYTLGGFAVASSSISFNAPFQTVNAYFIGRMDEIRIWNTARSAQKIMDSAFEIGEKGPGCVDFFRIASESNLSSLVLYIHDPVGATAQGSLPNEAPYSTLSSISVNTTVRIGNDTVMYIDQQPRIDPANTNTREIRLSAYTVKSQMVPVLYSGDLFLLDAAGVGLNLLAQIANYDDAVVLTSIPSAPWSSGCGLCSFTDTSVGITYQQMDKSILYQVTSATPTSIQTVPFDGFTMQFDFQFIRCFLCAPDNPRRNATAYRYQGQWTLQSIPVLTLTNLPSTDVFIGIGNTLSLSFTATVANAEQSVSIQTRIGPSSAALQSTSAVSTSSQCGASSATAQMVYTPSAYDAGNIYRTCLFASATPLAGQCPGGCQACADDLQALQNNLFQGGVSPDLCFWVHVVLPNISVAALRLPPSGGPVGVYGTEMLVPAPGGAAGQSAYAEGQTFITFVGCQLGGPAGLVLMAADLSTAAASVSAQPWAAPYHVTIAAVEQESEMCDTVMCQPIPDGLPAGAALVAAAAPAAGQAQAALQWVPRRGQELDMPYRLCFAGRPAGSVGAALAAAGRPGETVTCYGVLVLKCQYCLTDGETIASLAAGLGVDELQLLFANPGIPRPGRVLEGQVIRIGAVYSPRAGDSLADLERRFFVSRRAILDVNPDVDMANGTLRVGGDVCITSPVCQVRCLQGSDCVLAL